VCDLCGGEEFLQNQVAVLAKEFPLVSGQHQSAARLVIFICGP
jgi:hypothetical protein